MMLVPKLELPSLYTSSSASSRISSKGFFKEVADSWSAGFTYRDVGKGRKHDCMDAGGRATQEQLPRSGSFACKRKHQQ